MFLIIRVTCFGGSDYGDCEVGERLFFLYYWFVGGRIWVVVYFLD